MSADDIVGDLIDRGWDYEEINEYLEDEGYDSEDIVEAWVDAGYVEAWVDAGYDWEEALHDAIVENEIDYDYFEEHAHEWADALDMDISDLYDWYFGYEETT